MLFSGDEVRKKLPTLSGGEAARLVFARLMLQHPNVLVLDEPTNHLDLEAIEALVEALQNYDGTLIFVSHDRWFVSQLAARIVEVRADGILDYPGTYDEYLAAHGTDHLEPNRAAVRAPSSEPSARAAKVVQHRTAVTVRPKKVNRFKLERQRDELSASIEAAEQRIEQIDTDFSRAGFYDETDPQQATALQVERTQLADELDDLIEQWAEIETALAEADVD